MPLKRPVVIWTAGHWAACYLSGFDLLLLYEQEAGKGGDECAGGNGESVCVCVCVCVCGGVLFIYLFKITKAV